MTTRTPLRIAFAAVTLTLALGACGGGSTSSPETTPDAAPETAPAAAAEASTDDPLVARAAADLQVFAQPGDATPSTTLPAATGFGSARALLVDAVNGDWVQVLLPTRPNGSTGWIRAGDVELRRVDEAIEIDLTSRTLRLLVDGEAVVTTPVAIGTPTTRPPPAGSTWSTSSPPATPTVCTATSPSACRATPTSSPISPAATARSASTAPTTPPASARPCPTAASGSRTT